MELAAKEADQDRLSQLPDPILHRILSQDFLETKYVVRTCVLSKRWRNVWRSMPNLFFWEVEDEDEDGDGDGDGDGDEDEGMPIDFPTLVNTVLLRRDEDMPIDFPTLVNTVLLRRDALDVHSLRIWWFKDCNEHSPRHIFTWVQYAVNHNVRKLEIWLKFPLPSDYELQAYEFPSCIFTCPTLEDLKLAVSCRYSVLPEVVCLVLEDLHFEQCYLEDPDISSYSIKKLGCEGSILEGTRIRISIPSLQFLEISGNDMQGIKVLLEDLPSLVEASFQIENHDTGNSGDQELLKFISPRTMVASGEVLSEVQSFNKLRKLILHGCWMVDGFPTVALFLQHSPNLELLTLVQKRMDSFPTLEKWFVCSHRRICVVFQCGTENTRIFKLMTDFFNSKCDCFLEIISPDGMV